tara:strand:- start:58 stop:708 length:651 start_codon:yes stop_codon:yes gene_type:complete
VLNLLQKEQDIVLCLGYNMEEKVWQIESFIGMYDNYIPESECNKAIELFEKQNQLNNTLNRQDFEQAQLLEKADQQFFANCQNITTWVDDLKPLIANFDIALNHYANTTGMYTAYDQNQFFYTDLKLQRTLPGQGYHRWHVEHASGRGMENRCLAYTIYLNDIEQGGETEFIHQHQRVQPKTGRIVIWPAAFPFVHRGNAPLVGVKYILTSWMLLK